MTCNLYYSGRCCNVPNFGYSPPDLRHGALYNDIIYFFTFCIFWLFPAILLFFGRQFNREDDSRRWRELMATSTAGTSFVMTTWPDWSSIGFWPFWWPWNKCDDDDDDDDDDSLLTRIVCTLMALFPTEQQLLCYCWVLSSLEMWNSTSIVDTNPLPFNSRHFSLYYAPALGWGIMQWWPLSVCLSVCRSHAAHSA